MATYKYAEIPLSNNEMDKFSTESSVFAPGVYFKRFHASFHEVKMVARRICTERQYRVFCMLSQSKSVIEIAESMSLSKWTIYGHIRRLRKKMKKYYKI